VNFRIADTFTDSLARLTAQEQKAVKTTAFDLQMDPSAPGLTFHKLDRAKDKKGQAHHLPNSRWCEKLSLPSIEWIIWGRSS
jgi:hypothetical protein